MITMCIDEGTWHEERRAWISSLALFVRRHKELYADGRVFSNGEKGGLTW